MSYIKWNKALTNHFFNDKNKDREVILYADKNLINEIGKKLNLGNYDNFINSILIDFDSRCILYDEIIAHPRRLGADRVTINRELKHKIKEFPNNLASKTGKFDLVFFNYVIFYITVIVDNTEDNSFYNILNEIINKIIPSDNNTSILNGLDDIFINIELWTLNNKNGSLGIFRARRIGALAYIGLLKYQVVLKPNENKLFEEILYKYNISIDDNAIYPELANKLLPYVDNNSLRNKLIEAIKSPVYSEWFLNKALSFNHTEYGNSTIGSQIIVTRKGKMTFKIRLEDLSLILVSDTLLKENEIPIGFSLSQSGLDNYGYYSEPIQVLSHQKNSFKDYKLTTKDKSLELETIKINDVNFFVKTANGYILTLLPKIGNDLLVLVRYNNQIIKHWESWSANPNNIERSILIENYDNLLNLFGDNYVFYSASNIKKSYYKNEQNIIYEINSDTSLNLKKLGGLKINKNTYLDIGLPYFRLDNSEINSSEINVKVYRNSAKDNDISVERSNDKFRIFINNDVVINEPSLVIVKFYYQNLEKSFDFIIIGTKLKPISQNNLFKFNAWGEKALDTDIKYVQGNITINENKVLLNSNRHTLVGLVDTTSYDDNYFIYLLTGLDSLIEENYLKRKHINKAIDASLIYLESQGYQISDEKYSRTNLISNLCALGFLNKLMDDNEVIKYQLLPPALIKIEKAFSVGSKQVYQLLGTRSKYMIQRLVEFCENENIQIRYKRYNIEENNTLEKALLPEIVYLDIGEKLNKIKAFFEDGFDINIYVEDKYHIGDSLNKFIESTSEFESKYLTQKINLGNQTLDKTDTISFPRIVESSELYQSLGQAYKKRFLEKRENEFYNIKDLYWSKLYVAKENNLPVLLMKKQYDSGVYKLSPNTYIPSKYRLPEIVYRAFCSINHGIPKTIKVFIKNANGIFNVEDQSYMHFDYYKFSDKENRRDNIIRIITGSTDFNSDQVIFCNELNKNMKFITCSLYSNIKDAVLIFDIKGACIAIISNYKELFVNADKSDNNGINTKKCQFIGTEINILKVNNNELSLNQMISLVLENNFKEFNYETPYRDIKFDIMKEEKIIIKEIF